jgi:hypothetical protein
MLDGSYDIVVSACGVTVRGQVAQSATEGIEPIDTTLPVGHAGALTTATIAMVTGHGLTDGTFDVHWAGGCRYGCAIDFTGDSGAVTGGSGDSLPVTAATPVVVTAAVSLDVTFDGDNAVLVGLGATQQTHFRFVDSGGAVIGQGVGLLGAGGAWGWALGNGSNPLSGNAVAALVVSNGSATGTSALKLTGLQHAT